MLTVITNMADDRVVFEVVSWHLRFPQTCGEAWSLRVFDSGGFAALLSESGHT
jgi:hypothetical protein